MRQLAINPKLFAKYHLDLRILLIAFLFYLSARLGYFLEFENTKALPVWPPSGIAFALIILLGRTAWPGIMIGSLLANVMAYWNTQSLPAQTIIALSMLSAMAQTLEALTGNFLIKEWVKETYPFNNTRNTFQFLLVVMAMCVAGTSIHTLSLYFNKVITADLIISTGFSGWVGNVVGILLFTPVILSCAHFSSFKVSSESMVEIGALALLIIGVSFMLQLRYFNTTIERALPFLILPLLLWLAFRFGLVVAMSVVLLVSLLSIYVTTRNDGPFVLSDAYLSMLLLQIFIGVMSLSTIVLSATVRERMEAQKKLLEFNETLEAKVAERTKELNDEITIRKEAEENLQKTNQELSKRNTELDNFVYSVSHDLRAPIASVLGLINLARKDEEGTMKNTYLDMIHKSATQQDHFIRDILDQSRNSRLEIKREEIFFEPIIEETFNQLRYATAAEKPVEKIIHIRQNKAFYSDRWRLKVILNNIISNAIRYRNGKDPVIKVDVEVDPGGVQMKIEDNGKGIAREHLANVCKMFYRATDDGAGSGLGLYIVKETVDRLNGSILIDSEVGRGTIVKLTIPEVMA